MVRILIIFKVVVQMKDVKGAQAAIAEGSEG
jgi:hypothetical protein